MKKGRRYTLRGRCEDYSVKESRTGDGTTKVQLFDGKFTTGYRILDFQIMSPDVSQTAVQNFSVKLMTRDNETNHEVWDWDDQSEVGWAMVALDGNSASSPVIYSHWDDEVIVIEDLHIYCHSNNIPVMEFCNYSITLEQVTFSEAMGALTMSRDAAVNPGP